MIFGRMPRAAVVFAISSMLIVVALPFSHLAFAQERRCVFEKTQGQATVANQALSGGIAPGQTIAPGDTLRTGPDGRVEIKCSDGILVSIGADTELELASLVGEGDKRGDVLLNLNRGIGRFFAPTKTWDIFSIFGPSAAASMESGDLIMTASEGATAVLSLEGEVAVKAKKSGGARLSRGSGIDVDGDGRVVKSGKWGAARVAKVKAAIGL